MSLLTLTVFADKYDLSIPSLVKKVPKEHPARSCKGYIDEEYFLRRLKFKKKAILTIHDFYYVLTKYMSTRDIARMVKLGYPDTNISSLEVYINGALFNNRDNQSILQCNLSTTLWRLYRTSQHYKIWVKDKTGIKPDFNKLLDRRIEDGN